MGVEIPTDAGVGSRSLSVMAPWLSDSVGPMTASVLRPAMQTHDVFDPLDGAGQSRLRHLQERAAVMKLQK
jgi:hypothetical protein